MPHTHNVLWKRTLGRIWWVFPAVQLGVGLFVPALRLPVLEPVPAEMQVQLLLALLVSLVLAFGWVMAEFFYVTYQFTPLKGLRYNVAVSLTIALALTFVVVYSLALDKLMWGFIIPWIAAVIDAYVSGDRAINNAAQKPIAQIKGGHGGPL